jgi:uncharacterized protein YgbK (DUF1537 family)
MRYLDAKVLENYPEKHSDVITGKLQEEIQDSNSKIVVLDDDPTGIQTVHGVSVYTDWDESSILAGFQEDRRLFYILTNSRSFTGEHTAEVHREIGVRIEKVSRELGIPYLLISRSDSTLRGHYPLETEVLRSVMEEQGSPVDGEILCPFFLEGGRYTLDNVHYVKSGGQLIPAGETEFARDVSFGYRASNLRQYIEEKTKGVYKGENVISISMEDLREEHVEKIEEQLLSVSDFQKIIVNAAAYSDLEVFCLAFYRAMRKGKRYLMRTAASIVKVVGGISDQPLLSSKELKLQENNRGGIIVVGSHTQKTTNQLEQLRGIPGLEFIAFRSELVLKPEELKQETERVQLLCNTCMEQGKTPVIYTSRNVLVLEDDTKEKALDRAGKISEAVQSFVGNLSVRPAFVVAKGGITSSDVGTKALKVKRAEVLGQIQPGVPVWKTGRESRFPDIPYVIFPGNVGEEETLKKAVLLLLNL